MFTGLIQHVGAVREVIPNDSGVRLLIDVSGWLYRPAPGDSIAVNGACLTVVEGAGDPTSGVLGFDCIRQTLDVTTLGRLVPGSRVNLERAMAAADLLGGHVVQGHVDGVGRVAEVRGGANEHRVRIEAPAEIGLYLMPKGSIAVDGVSLTLAAISEPGSAASWFDVALIPSTLALTTLGQRARGDHVNLEADVLAKMVVTWLRRCGIEPAALRRDGSGQGGRGE
jgi:riboflavin synthase